MALEDLINALEHRVEQRYAEFKQLRGVVNAEIRHRKARELETASEDAPGSTNGDAEVSQHHPARAASIARGPRRNY